MGSNGPGPVTVDRDTASWDAAFWDVVFGVTASWDTVGCGPVGSFALGRVVSLTCPLWHRPSLMPETFPLLGPRDGAPAPDARTGDHP
ncbi:hypothetical protein Slu03_17500 [Sediminihabitans luteus]|nr:hypothetical protein Slu03_17500 [Sediminihabitans luteus]